MKIKSVSESYILIKNNKSERVENFNQPNNVERVCCKINVKNRSEPSIKIDAGWYQRVGISDKNRQPKRVGTFNESEGRKRVRNVYKYERK